MSWDIEAERELWADICMKDFWWFVQISFGVAHNPQGWWLCERIHKPICDWFQRHIDEWFENRKNQQLRQKNLLVVIPRDFGKTVLITKAGLLWLHLRDPELSTYIGSVTEEQAVDFLAPVKRVMSGGDMYQQFTWLYGSWYDKQREWTTTKVVHAIRRGLARGEPSFGVWGVATGLTGYHPDVICLDDPITYDQIERHSDWLNVVNKHVASLIPVLKGNGLRIFIGTRYGDGDWIGRALRLHGAASISGMMPPGNPVREDGLWHLYFFDARDASGKPTYPERWSEDKLKEQETEDAHKYWAQLRNDPASEDIIPLTRRKVEELWVDPKDVPKNLRISVHVDTSFKYKERQARGDWTVIEVWGHARDGSGDVYYLEGYGSQTWNAREFNNKLIIVLQSLRSRGRWPFILTDEVELGGKQGTWELTLENWCHSANLPKPAIKLLNRQGKNKLSRHVAAASFWNDNKVWLVKGAPGVEQLIDQMVRIGVSQHDDWVDPAADVFHPEVYKPVRLKQDDESVELRRPYDPELQQGTLTIMQQIRAARAEQELMRQFREPISG